MRWFRAFSLLALAAWPLHAGEVTVAARDAHLSGGLVALVNCGEDTLAEAAKLPCTVHCLDADAARVQRVRIRLQQQGIYGRVCVTHFDGRALPYIDGLINLVVCEKVDRVPAEEIQRVLAPGGMALVKTNGTWARKAKPWPDDTDEWNQYLHDADNNAVSADKVGPPARMKWVGGTRWGRSHMSWVTVTSMVSAKGRVYTIEDLATIEYHLLPARFHVIARDAFNGCELWRRPLTGWHQTRSYVKFVPVQIQRRMAAIGEKLYCTPGYDEPITLMDGATGAVLTTFAGTERTREFVFDRGVLYAIIGDAYAPPRSKDEEVLLQALDATSGRVLWQKTISQDGGYVGGTLAVKRNNLAYCTKGGVECLEADSGKHRWRAAHTSLVPGKEASLPRSVAKAGLDNIPPTLVLDHERLYCSTIAAVRAYAVESGKRLWTARNAPNYMKGSDLFVAGGLVWTGLLVGHDPETGEVKRTIKQQMLGPMGHDRCYRNRITETYYINSKTGGSDFLKLADGSEFPSPWVRGTCGLGVLPCNGLLYSSPYSCSCVQGTLLTGFTALYGAEDGSGKAPPPETQVRLIQGPAYGTTPAEPEPDKGDWPAYRHDNARSGRTDVRIGSPLATQWKVTLRSQPTAPTVVRGTVYVAARNAHTLHALSLSTGQEKWRFTAGGRIDSPPTFHRGFVLFGSRDGWVTCLRASDGALAWTFSDLPIRRLICAHGQLESAWPVNGSVMVQDGVAYFAAGRSSFLDGGIVVYGLDPLTGKTIHRRQMSGPYTRSGFPALGKRHTRIEGFKSGVFSSEGDLLYIRHQAFKRDLTPVPLAEIVRPHLIASAGFLDDVPQHRTYWTIDTDLCYGPNTGTAGPGPQGDILAMDGDAFYEVRGYLPGRHSTRMRPQKGYTLYAGARAAKMRGPASGRERRRTLSVPMSGRWKERWAAQIPLTGYALAVAGDTLLVAGAPLRASYGNAELANTYAGKLGGVLWTATTKDGSKIAEMELPAPPVWDGMAVAQGKCLLALKNGDVMCLGTDGPSGALR